MDKPIKLAIKYNNVNVSCCCAICKKGMDDVFIPLALFMANDYEPVCNECGLKYAPDLIYLLHCYYHVTYTLPGFIIEGKCEKPETAICNVGYACDACPFNKEVLNEKRN